MNLDINKFDVFFHELWGYDPFPWQYRLAEKVLGDDWPEALTVPTSAGKTSCIDIAIFALAAKGTGKSPRRIFFVVDRRVIVDEAFERARKLAVRLENKSTGVVGEVAKRLKCLAGGDTCRPLECVELRGGIRRDRGWVQSPLQPMVVCSTVDQTGSRLLFRGYGESNYVWPIHAALVGNDSLILLDEAHCSNPFRQTVEAVKKFRMRAANPIPLPFGLCILSATPPHDITHNVIGLDKHDRTHPILGKRILARKSVQLAEVERDGDLAKRLAKEAIDLAKGQPQSVAVIVNRVRRAKEIADELHKKGLGDVVLMTGRMRPYDKDKVIEHWTGKLRAGERDNLDRPLFVVATQCLEVGANFDFDTMACEAAPIDALRQRFGRLNRLGERKEAHGCVIASKQNLKEEDSIYGTALAETWKWLNEISSAGTMDMGIAAMDKALDSLRKSDPPRADKLTVEADNAPVMLPAHVERWMQTSPVPMPDPDVSVFLHGTKKRTPEVQVCWRADLDPNRPELWREVVSLCPPTIRECMPVQMHVLNSWWTNGKTVPDDLEGGAFEKEEKSEPVERCLLAWRGSKESELVHDISGVRPGDTLAVPVSMGGWDELGHKPSDSPPDLGEETRLDAGSILRVHPGLAEKWQPQAWYQRLLGLAGNIEAQEEMESSVREVLKTSNDAPGPLIAAKHVEIIPYPGVKDGQAWEGYVIKTIRVDTQQTDEDDATSAGPRVELQAHMDEVGTGARRLGIELGLDPLTDELEKAGKCHDMGKADDRFQGWLRSGNMALARAEGILLAKSPQLSINSQKLWRAKEKAGYPDGARHELVSVRLAELNGRYPDLVLHLIGSHHGRCRPFAPVVDDLQPITVTYDGKQVSSDTDLQRLDSGIASRFWRLNRMYGPWGLAMLESLVRLSDWQASKGKIK